MPAIATAAAVVTSIQANSLDQNRPANLPDLPGSQVYLIRIGFPMLRPRHEPFVAEFMQQAIHGRQRQPLAELRFQELLKSDAASATVPVLGLREHARMPQRVLADTVWEVVSAN